MTGAAMGSGPEHTNGSLLVWPCSGRRPWSAVAAATAFRVRLPAQSIQQESRRLPYSQRREHQKAVAAATALQTMA